MGTHIDAPMHAADVIGDVASLPLTKLVHEGVIVDVSDVVGDWDIIKPKHITDKVKVKKGDILIIHTGYHQYYEGMPEKDLTRYFCMHPGATNEMASWMLDMEISWWGVDTGSADHPMNTTIRTMRPDLTRQFEEKVGMSVGKYFGDYTYRHPKSGRLVKEDLFPMHYLLFPSGCVHAENVGGDLAKVLNQRCIIGAFPWKFEGGEALSVPDHRLLRRGRSLGGGDRAAFLKTLFHEAEKTPPGVCSAGTTPGAACSMRAKDFRSCRSSRAKEPPGRSFGRGWAPGAVPCIGSRFRAAPGPSSCATPWKRCTM